MRELLTVLVGRFGPGAILIVVILGASVWSITHWTAQQSETVSVFWGMVEYTKGSNPQQSTGTGTGLPPAGAYLLRAAASGDPLMPDQVAIRVKSDWLSHPADVVGLCLNQTLAQNSLLTPDTVRLC